MVVLAVPLEITGMNQWDVEELNKSLKVASLPEDAVAINNIQPSAEGMRSYEPATITLAIAIAHYVVPAVASVIKAVAVSGLEIELKELHNGAT
jgi:hypothetical protein